MCLWNTEASKLQKAEWALFRQFNHVTFKLVCTSGFLLEKKKAFSYVSYVTPYHLS